MIVQEFLWPGTVKTFSSEGKYIIQDGTGDKYPEAIDPAEMHRTYTESDELIPLTEEENDDSYRTAEE